MRSHSATPVAVLVAIILGAAGCTREPPDDAAVRLFPDNPLPLDSLRAVDRTIFVQLASIELSDLVLRDVSLPIVSRGSILEIRDGAAVLAEGDVQFSMRVDGPMGAPHVVFDAHAEGVHLGLLPALDEMLDGGASRITVHLDGYGNNIRDILASANGGLLLIAGGGQLRSRRLDSVSAGLVAGLLATLNPLSKPQPSELECAVLRFDIHDGIAHSDRGIGLQTRKVSVVGMGRVDLRTEQVDLGVRPQPRGAIARTDNAFAGVIRITGTLRAPRAEISTQYMLQEGTALGSTLATAGLSNLAGFLHQRVVDTANACQAAANPKPTYSDTEDADHDKADEGSVNGLLPGGYRD